MRSFFFLALTLSIPPLSSCLAQSHYVPLPTYEFSLAKETDLPIVLEQIRQSLGIEFTYSPDLLAGIKVPGRQIYGKNLEEMVAALLAGTPVSHRIVDQQRVLLRREPNTPADPSENEITIGGWVTDVRSGQKLPFAAVVLDTLELGTATDEEGHFTLLIPASLQDLPLHFRYLGFQDQTLTARMVLQQPQIRLEPSSLGLATVTVIDRLPSLTVSQVGLETEIQTKALANRASQVAGNDLLRSIQLLPGVAANDDLNAGIKIRGSDASETLVMLDGIPLYKMDHFYGIFSVVNSLFIDNVQLYKNALPVEYGGRTGGMLLMESGNALAPFSAQADINLLYSALKVSTPIRDHWGFTVGGRFSHTNLANSKFFDWVGTDRGLMPVNPEADFSRKELLQTSPAFHFYDLNAKLSFTPNSNSQWSLNFFNSRDVFSNIYQNSFTTRVHSQRATNTESFANEEDWSNLGSSFNYQGQLKNGWQAKANAFYSDFRNQGRIASSLSRSLPDEARTTGFENQQNNEIKSLGGRLSIAKETEAGHLQFGLGLNRHFTVLSLTLDSTALLNQQGTGTESFTFAEYRRNLTERWQITVGARLNYFTPTQGFYFSPAIKTSLALSSALSLKASFNINHQFVREISHENKLGQPLEFLLLSDDEHFPVGRSTNFMAGGIFKKGPWTVDLEFFHRDMEGVIEHASLFPGFLNQDLGTAPGTNYKLFVGDGQAIGIDALLSYHHRRYSGWIAYTLSRTTHRFEEIYRNEPFPAPEDRRHQLKWINTLHLGRFDLSANFLYSSGRPYTDFSRLKEPLDRRSLPSPDRRSYLPSYLRLDLGLAYNFEVHNTGVTVGLSVFNATNNANVKYLQYIYSLSSQRGAIPQTVNTIIGTETNLLNRTANFFVNVKF